MEETGCEWPMIMFSLSGFKVKHIIVCVCVSIVFHYTLYDETMENPIDSLANEWIGKGYNITELRIK